MILRKKLILQKVSKNRFKGFLSLKRIFKPFLIFNVFLLLFIFDISKADTNFPNKKNNQIEIEYLDYEGNKKSLKATGLLATCIQHEIDHLKGILFIDYLSKLKRDIILKKLSKQKIEQKRLVI